MSLDWDDDPDWDHHPACRGGCGQLADECECPRLTPRPRIYAAVEAAGRVWCTRHGSRTWDELTPIERITIRARVGPIVIAALNAADEATP